MWFSKADGGVKPGPPTSSLPPSDNYISPYQKSVISCNCLVQQ